jgi:hypothetical protein
MWAGWGNGGVMQYKRVAPELELKIQFGSKGVYQVKGILRTVGLTEKGGWFSLLVCKAYETRHNGIPMKGFHYIEMNFTLNQVVEGKEKLAPYFEGLK